MFHHYPSLRNYTVVQFQKKQGVSAECFCKDLLILPFCSCVGVVVSGWGPPPLFFPLPPWSAWHYSSAAEATVSLLKRLLRTRVGKATGIAGLRGTHSRVCAHRGEKGRTAAIKRCFKYPSVGLLCICTFLERFEAIPSMGLLRRLQGRSRQPVTVRSSYGKLFEALTGNHKR